MSTPQELSLDGELSIYRAAELRQWLGDAVTAGSELRIRLADVAEIDTAGAQLLLAGKRLAAERGCQLSYVAHSPAVLALLELLDLAGQLGDPIVLPARPAPLTQETSR